VAAVAGRCRRCGVHFVQAAVDAHYYSTQLPQPSLAAAESESDSAWEVTDDDDDDTGTRGLFLFVAADTAAAVRSARPLLRSLASEHHTVLGADPRSAASLCVARQSHTRKRQLRSLQPGLRPAEEAAAAAERSRHARRLATATQRAEHDGSLQVCARSMPLPQHMVSDACMMCIDHA
jgi:hypothetical protein